MRALIPLLVLAMIVVGCGHEDKSKPPRLPVVGDETQLTLAKADTSAFVGKPFTIIGGIEIISSYAWGYADAGDTHVSFRLWEARADRSFTGEYADLYLTKSSSNELVKTIAKSLSESPKLKPVRIKAVILPDRHYQKANRVVAEILNWQYLNQDRTKWGPWVLK